MELVSVGDFKQWSMFWELNQITQTMGEVSAEYFDKTGPGHMVSGRWGSKPGIQNKKQTKQRERQYRTIVQQSVRKHGNQKAQREQNAPKIYKDQTKKQMDLNRQVWWT